MPTAQRNKEKQLVKELGFEGLFDSAEAVYKLLSAKHLAEVLKRANTSNGKTQG